ncbi:MAG: SgcJ/EcaC family oxidoreductase [Rhodobacteraceae bacterium]|nr:SgcJ/EcaC family oxidoreductase [Paracoccaceae bacterium]
MRVLKTLLVVAGLVLFALAAGFSAASAQVPTPRDAVDRMSAAVAARDAAAVAALYASDAIVLGPGQAVMSGRDAIQRSWGHNLAGGYSSLTIRQAVTETGSDRAAMLVVWDARIEQAGGQGYTVHGRSLIYFTRTPQGWLISADMWQEAP